VVVVVVVEFEEEARISVDSVAETRLSGLLP